ncbi:aldehyde dehydrogenase (NADP(+)) [Stappia sp. ES.058]|uniref:aldehyde dehydrogenase (NADP(+)) n=1 Tax=Stappia sp. ES.058 TaxID=1881061 RepID=UPI00087AAA79|nr:aldehyde dehydrogenase (NADP(+)) [Stappia sp. ES.058]SDU45307.1 NADP-dependent aldehyde dehydrogenase [Stappia sp. ES.058]
MTYRPHGQHLVAGRRTGSHQRFESRTVTGPAHSFCNGGAEEIDSAVRAAEAAFSAYGQSTRAQRASFLEAIAEAIEARAEDLTTTVMSETGLPQARVEGERGRTTGQLRMFAAHIRDGAYLDFRRDEALTERTPPRPELRLCMRPLGPVGVFGASNFPLAFSTAGGDTASALAAGCPVVVKGHPAHPATGELVAEAINEARVACGLPDGVFSFIQSADRAAGEALVTHPLVQAIGFTGSLRGGRALFDLCASREEPIPFFGELGSVNPVFVLEAAQRARGAAIARDWAASLVMGVGQFCTNPGVVVLQEGEAAEAFIAEAAAALSQVAPQTMLTADIATSFKTGVDALSAAGGTVVCRAATPEDRQAAPALLRTQADRFLAEPHLAEEVFGPLGLVVTVSSREEMKTVAEGLRGQLTCTLQLDQGDHDQAQDLVPVLERKAGRLLVNGYPTGVEVCDAMVHGGPYPASTNFGATSVGSLAIRRFLRPVCYQNMPEDLLPQDARTAS